MIRAEIFPLLFIFHSSCNYLLVESGAMVVEIDDDKSVSHHPGVYGMYYQKYSDNSLAYKDIQNKIPTFPQFPRWAKVFPTFWSEGKYSENHVARNVGYFNAPTSGDYTFYLICKERCQVSLTRYGCDMRYGWTTPHVVTSNIRDTYADEYSAVTYTLTEKYRYCIEVLQKAGKGALNWIGLGVKYPNGIEELPMTSVYHIPDLFRVKSLHRYYPDSSATVELLLSNPEFPNSPKLSECSIAGQTASSHRARHYRQDLWIYRKFWYTYHKPQYFKLRKCDDSDCYIYVNGEKIDSKHHQAFVVNFDNKHWSTELFEIFQFAKKDKKETFELVMLVFHHNKGKDAWPDYDLTYVVHPDHYEHRPAPHAQGLSSTSLTAASHHFRIRQAPPIGATAYSITLLKSKLGGVDVTLPYPPNSVFTNLQIWTEYSLASNLIGNYIIHGNSRKARTLEDVPSSLPLDLKLIALSSTEIKSTWGDTLEQNGVIVGYDVEYAKVELDGSTVVPPWQMISTHVHHGDIRTLVIPALDFWDYYAVRVATKTAIGAGNFSTYAITRTLEDTPTGPAQNITGYNNSETSLHINWDYLTEEEANGIILGYEIGYKLTSGNNWQYQEVTGKDTLYADIDSLDWFADYDISVAGITAPGIGVHGDASVLRTDEWKPQVPPPNVAGIDTSSTSLQITFDNIADTFQIFGYAVESKVRFTRSDDGSQTGIQYGGVNGAEVIGLNEYTDYDIEVAIMTRRGGEVFSAPIVVKTGEAPPSEPPDGIRARKLSSTSVIINCGLIDYEERNGIVLQYNFTVREKYVGTWETHLVPENDGDKELTLTGLEKWRYYEYIVSGCTSMGCGRESEIKQVRTDQDVPENVPDNFTVAAISSTELNVTWDEVPEGTRRGLITGYTVQYSDTTLPQPEWIVFDLPDEPRILVIENLKFFTNYTVMIKAKTKKGYGDYSSEFWMATFEDVPAVHPYNLTCNNATSRSIKCTWEPVPEIHGYANGIVRGYNIYYSVLDCAKAELADCNETEVFVDTIPAPLLEHFVIGLDNFTEYNIEIDLFNGVSPGPKTPVMIIYTDEDIPSSPPAKVEGFTATTTSVMSFWDGVPWGEKHGIILGYIVYYRRMNEGPPSDYLRQLMREQNKKRKRRSVENANYDISYNTNTAMEEDYGYDTNDIYDGVHSRERRAAALYDGMYIYPEEEQIVVNASAIGTTIVGLVKYQWYTLRVAAYTSKGHGPTFDFNVSCAQEVPWAAPEITVFDRFSFGEIRINWTEITYNQSRGTVFDYNIIYYPVNVRGSDLSPYEQIATSIWLEYPASALTIRGLKPYTRYAFQSAALTFAGVGVYSRQFFGETCRCEKHFYTAYRNIPPFFWIDPNTGQSEGIMKGFVEEATSICCSSCVNGHGETIVNWDLDKTGNDSLKTNVVELNIAVLNEAEFILPIENSKLRSTYNTKSYVSVVESSGVAIYSRKIEYINPTSEMILYATSIIWTFVILFSLAVIGLGFFMWILQCNPLILNRKNQEQFPDDFLHGGGAGVWWAVSSMMRIGYGDIVATGKIGRVFSMPVILLGLVMGSTLISGFSSVYLSYIFTKSQGGVFSKKVVTLEDSFDSKVVQRLGGKVTEKVPTVDGLIDALRSGRVDRIAVDSLYGSHQSIHMRADDIVYRGLKESGGTQGIVLGGSSTLLEACFKQYLFDKSSLINARVKEVVDADQKVYADDEYTSKMVAVVRYESDIWMLTIQVSGGLFFGALLIGIIWECKHRKKNKIHANILIHTRCDKFFGTESTDLIKDFTKHMERKLEQIDVKHAFQRIELITNLRKRVEWLTPDQVNKYKF